MFLLLALLLAMPVVVAEEAIADKFFLQGHWPGIISAQGKAPADYSRLEASLAPQDCGVCHVQQWQDWQGSRHSRSMGPGVLGQLSSQLSRQVSSQISSQLSKQVQGELTVHATIPPASDLATSRSCSRCHAPLHEQQAYVPTVNDASAWQPSAAFDAALQYQGLVCAACHVRRHQRHGPPRSQAMNITGPIDEGLPHGGFIAELVFSQSEFCSYCHQFQAEDFRLNGKLIENTYEEWRQSDYPAQGKSCQSCHMPGRRHRWQGIHDVDMVRQAVTMDVRVIEAARQHGDRATVNIELTNSGAGHYFPTYMTPKVFVRAELIDAAGQAVTNTFQEAVIGRDATLDLSRELYDTRIAPHDSTTIVYQQTLPADNLRLKFSIVVEPDHYYEKFYRALLADGDGVDQTLIEQAWRDTQQSHFTVYEKVLSLAVVTDSSDEKGASVEDGSAVIPSVPGDKRPGQRSVSVDWNDQQIAWFDYAEGIKQAASHRLPIMLVLYADWCVTCHAYKKLFYDQAVVTAAQGFVMVRVNVDQESELNKKYAFDGDYVPRVILMDDQGKVRHEVYSRKGVRYFVSAEESAELLWLMRDAL